MSGVAAHPGPADYVFGEERCLALVPFQLGRHALEPMSLLPEKSILDIPSDRVIQDHRRLHPFKYLAPAWHRYSPERAHGVSMHRESGRNMPWRPRCMSFDTRSWREPLVPLTGPCFRVEGSPRQAGVVKVTR